MVWVLFLVSLAYLVISVVVFAEDPAEEGYAARITGFLYGAILYWSATNIFGGG